MPEDQGNKCGFYGAAELNEAKSGTKMPFLKKKNSQMQKFAFK